jgi:two-component system response regulator AtoC
MLARVLLCVRPVPTERRLAALLDDSDTLVEAVRGQRSHLWLQALRRAGDLVVVSRDLIPSPATDHVRALRDSPETPAVVVLVEDENAEENALLLAAGADQVLHRDLDGSVAREILLGLLEQRREMSAERLRTSHPGGDPRLADFVSRSPSMQAFMDVVHRVVDSPSSILLLGETGVGKERLARAIHAESPRAAGPFVAVNCGALPESLLESELFGHTQGAFTGAARARRGWFELAHGGTVFLDEVGEMPLHLQVKLLRVLQEREIQPLGSERVLRVDVRVMAASNRDLEDEAAQGTFRSDLYYRLGVVSLEVPPLRKRRMDIADLVESFIAYHARTIGREVEGIESDALAALESYGWPGNVRELTNVVERAVLLCEESEIGLADLPVVIQGDAGQGVETVESAAPAVPTPASGPPSSWLGRTLREVREEALETTERSYLEALLADTGGRIGETARRAGIRPRSLYDKMRKHGLRKEDFKARPT